MFDDLQSRGFEIEYSSHAKAILEQDFPDIVVELERALGAVSLPITEIIGSGGGEAQLTQRLRRGFHDRGWQKRNIEMKKIVDGVEKDSISHEIDHYHATDRGNFALEIEWNNKDPFFDRDLESFKRLHAEGVIGIGSIITRGSNLQAMLRDLIAGWAHRKRINSFADLKAMGLKRPTERQEKIVQGKIERGASFEDAWASMFFSDKFGQATTHWTKLMDRVARGVGNPCPLLLIGLPSTIVDMNA
ncbi:BglII/BstYI family type II restriction endonuclease [Erythrobacter sp.]|uniref:BglII/BstYI family type II restriction endonuclease n=1 Tax=Erythrobacter sp. TaxID=1042 RepID=UPI003C773FC0